MRVSLIASFVLFSVVAVACGGEDFTPRASGGAGTAGTAAAGNGGKAGTSSGGANAAGTSGAGAAGANAGGADAGGAAGTASGGSAGATTGGAAGAAMGKTCDKGADCGKADPCKGVPFCSNHTCYLDTSAVPNIEDNNKCTKDACNSATGLPTHTPIPVGDGNPCTKDTCDPVAGPAHVVDPACTGCKSNAECDDGDPCTEDTCESTKCSSKPKAAGAACGSGDACTGQPTCDAEGLCQASEAKVVDDGNECTLDSCDPTTGQVKHLPRPVDDGDACTTDACDPALGLSHDKIPLDDGNACTKDVCDKVKGVDHPKVELGDNDVCTTDSCDPLLGPKYTPIPMCTGKCTSGDDCKDGNPCTKDVCTAGVCSNPNDDGASCDDGKFCTTADKCAQGACVGGGPLPVDDGKACTVDTCNEEKDTIVNADVPVDDNDPCTQDSCDPSGKVVHTPILDCCREDAQCEKIVPASDVTVCRKAGGTCQPTNKCLKNIETVIDDGIACTKDLCDPATGTVTHPPSAKVGECCASDADCPGGDRGGKCFAPGTCGKATFTCAYNEGKPIDDGILCTTDSCNAATGAVINAVPAGTKCCSEDSECPKQEDTGAFCKPGSMCDQGVCVPRGTGMPRPGGDLECLAYRCAPDGSWATCCVASNPDCVCLEPTPGSVCDNGGIKQ